MWVNRRTLTLLGLIMGVLWISAHAAVVPALSSGASPGGSLEANHDASALGGNAIGSVDTFLKIRDPFRAPNLKTTVEAKPALEQDPVESFQLVGVLTGLERLRAIVRNQAGTSFFVAQGTKIGIREGFVLKITPSGMMVREKMINILGQVGTVDTELKIRTSDLSQIGHVSRIEVPESHDSEHEHSGLRSNDLAQDGTQKQNVQAVSTGTAPSVSEQMGGKGVRSQNPGVPSVSAPSAVSGKGPS